MSDKLSLDDSDQTEEKVSRRGVFKFAVKVGVGLVAFVPAAAVLLQNSPTAHAAGPDYIPCTEGEICVGQSCSGESYAWVDAREPSYVCCCTYSCNYHPSNC